MVTNEVALCQGPLNKCFAIFFNVLSCYKKSRRNILDLEHIEDRRGMMWMWAIIECEMNPPGVSCSFYYIRYITNVHVFLCIFKTFDVKIRFNMGLESMFSKSILRRIARQGSRVLGEPHTLSSLGSFSEAWRCWPNFFTPTT